MLQKFALGTYYISIVITDIHVISRIQKYSDKILTCASLDRQKVNNLHITLVPPFHANCIEVSHMSMSCRCAKDMKNHFIDSTHFSVRELDVMTRNTKKVFHLPVFLEEGALKTVFYDYAKKVRERAEKLDGFRWKHMIPGTFYPHITVASIPVDRVSEHMTDVITDSLRCESLTFQAKPPLFFVKDETGAWYPLSNDL